MPTTTTLRRKRGRPAAPHGVLATYTQLSFYVPPALIAALDRLADAEATRTGLPVTRTDVMRRVLTAHCQAEGTL